MYSSTDYNLAALYFVGGVRVTFSTGIAAGGNLAYWFVYSARPCLCIIYSNHMQDELSYHLRLHFHDRRCHRRGVLGLAICWFHLLVGCRIRRS